MVDREKIIWSVNNPILLAVFSFCLGSVLSKKVGYAYASDSVHPLQIVYARFFFALIIIGGLFISLKIILRLSNKGFISLKSISTLNLRYYLVSSNQK